MKGGEQKQKGLGTASLAMDRLCCTDGRSRLCVTSFIMISTLWQISLELMDGTTASRTPSLAIGLDKYCFDFPGTLLKYEAD